MKKILAMLLACVMVFSSTIVCFAGDNTELSDKETKEVATSMFGEGTPLPITEDAHFECPFSKNKLLQWYYIKSF